MPMLPDAETFADQILDLTNQLEPPTDIRGILGRWPHLSIVETELDGDGMFVDLGAIGGEILVKKDTHETRKRFTIAHELGHFLLRHHLKETSESDNIESWCNTFAASVLLPKEKVLRHLRRGGMRSLTQQLVEGPNIFQVSEKAFYLRTSRLFPISIFTLFLSPSSVKILDSFRNQDIEELTDSNTPTIDQDTETFAMSFMNEHRFGQRELKLFDRILVARELRAGPNSKTVLLAILGR
jgi:hypothetical protein